MKTEFDILIVGAGLVGLTAAIACAQSGASVAVIDRRAQDDMPDDFRASAIAASAVRMLIRLGVDFGDHAQPIQDMMAYEGRQNSPDIGPWKIHFDEADKLGVMIENIHLRAALWEALGGLDSVKIIAPAEIISHIHEASGVEVLLEGRDAPLTA